MSSCVPRISSIIRPMHLTEGRRSCAAARPLLPAASGTVGRSRLPGCQYESPHHLLVLSLLSIREYLGALEGFQWPRLDILRCPGQAARGNWSHGPAPCDRLCLSDGPGRGRLDVAVLLFLLESLHHLVPPSHLQGRRHGRGDCRHRHRLPRPYRWASTPPLPKVSTA